MASWWPFGKKKDEPKKTSARMYNGAMYGRLVSDWIAQGTSIDSEIRSSLRALRNRARQLERENDFVRQYLRAVENNVIGEGIRFQSQVKMQRGGKLNDAVNDLIEAEFDKWCRKDCCHVAGKLSFQDIERLVMRQTAGSGEIVLRMVTQKFGRSKVPLALEVIESDRLDDYYNGVSEGGNEIRMGVEIDQWGRPVAYYFLVNHPGDYLFIHSQVPTHSKRMRVPAEEIIHVFRVERPGQTRGVPWLASSIMRLHQLQGYDEATVIAARAAASTMGFIESPEGEVLGDDVVDSERVTDFQPGVFKYLAPGEKVTVPSFGEPSAQYDPFLRAQLRAVAAGGGVSYEAISKDFSQSNYSSSRLSLLEERDHWKVLQDWVIENFHQVVFEKWLDLAVLSGALNLGDYWTNQERYQKVRWQPRGWAWVDPQKEVEAYRKAVTGGLLSLSDVVAQQGDDIDELMKRIKRERDLAKSLDLTFDTDHANSNLVLQQEAIIKGKMELGESSQSSDQSGQDKSE